MGEELGSWRVQRPDGTVVGHNNIRRQGDCFLHERYATPAGYQGESLNVYDGARGVWHQSWVDNGGLLPARGVGGLGCDPIRTITPYRMARFLHVCFYDLDAGLSWRDPTR